MRELKSDLSMPDQNFYKLMFFCFLGCLCIVAGFYFPFICYIGLAFFFVVALFQKGIERVYILLFTLPFYNVFRCSTEQITFCAFLFAFVVILISIEYVIQIIKKQKNINIKNAIVFGILMLFFILPIGSFSIMNSLRLELGLVLIYLCWEYREKLNFKQIVFSLFFGLSLACILNPIRYVNAHLNEFLTPFYSYIGNFYRFCGLAFDPNYFSVEVILLITCFTQLYMKNKINYIFYPVMMFLSIVGILTVSKSFLIVFMLYVVLSIIGCVIKWKSNVRAKYLLTVFIVLSMCLVLAFSKFIGVIVQRFTDMSAIDVNGNDNVMNHITTGRSDLWTMYLKKWLGGGFLAILFGYGNNQPYLTTNDGVQAMHNLYIEVLYHFGLVGFVLVFGFVLYALISYISKNKINYFNFIPLICVMIILFSINSFISYRPAFIVITLMFSFSQILVEQTEKKNILSKKQKKIGGDNEIINNHTSL